MATVNKDFKIKSGLIVEGSTATVNGLDVLTKKQADQDYIVSLIGGTATSANTANTVVKRDASGNFAAGTITANLTGQVSTLSNHDTADLAEGTNLYFTNQRALDATVAAYDAAGSAASAAGAVAGDLTDHENATAAHGATGAVVGTTNTQTLTNKTIGDTLNFTGAGAMTINSDSHIVLTPAGGSSVKWGADVLATQSFVTGAITDLDLAGSYDPLGSADTAETDAKAYTDLLVGDVTIDGTGGNTVAARISQAVADLVDSAPAALDTLNELAAALGDDVELVTGLATSIGNKLPLAGGSMTGAIAMGTNKITGLGTPTAGTDAATKDYVDNQTTTDVAEGTNLYFTDQRALDATALAYDATGTAQGIVDALDTDDIEEGLSNLYFTNQRAIDAVGGTIDGAINLLDTDDIEEGETNQYFTDGRAKASAADLLTGATLSNITITGSGTGLTITAENGVADSDTDDLVEGTTNFYFTDVRAVDALEAVVPNFTAVEINSVAKEVAAAATIAVAGTETALSWAKADYKTAKALVKFGTATHTEVSEILLTIDSSDNVAITEYAEIGTNGALGTVTATVVGGDVRINVTTLNNATTVIVKATLLA